MRTVAQVNALRRGGDKSGKRPRGKLRTIVAVDRGGMDLTLDCGHVVRPPYGPWFSGDYVLFKAVGDRRECLPCAQGIVAAGLRA